jgi:hypothetical protein
MSGPGVNRSWRRFAVLAVAALILAVLGVLVARAYDGPPGGEHCDPGNTDLGGICS